ncbi:gamma-glutamyltransferase family protein [Colwellia echini]|uniref:Gamma-glutamyltranspeptidase n=1 Tax=Colwellia echini TaxID=1982103 RepID=A0ABY3MZI1_9GAMM|nr:gamma-glutamyltransferase [Colwellia echini]TYK66633.1 gamma-glutamyltranspeptidase [Colwellia echini]
MTQANIAFTAPHADATEAGINILKEGGTATEAMVAAAAMITVVYPHMNSIGGDGFWLIDNPEQKQPFAIDACGRSAANISDYNSLQTIPARGGLSALTQAGTIRGWEEALRLDKNSKLPLSRILAPAIDTAKRGFTVSASLQAASEKLATVEQRNSAFNALYQPNGSTLKQGDNFKSSALANTFEHLTRHGLSSFYQGELAQSFVKDLSQAGSPLTEQDLLNTKAIQVTPLTVNISGIDCFNLPAPTQGVNSLQILAVIDQLKQQATSEADWVHLIVEATKQSFTKRPDLWADPVMLTDAYQQALSAQVIEAMANDISMNKAKPWPLDVTPGDTVWMASRDKYGQLVSFIQSIYWEFGSGVAMSEGGFVWNNRGVSFTLATDAINTLSSEKKPAHTLNPALAKFSDGRRLAYGTMGGEGQPQTQAAIFTGYVWRNKTIQQAVADPRWLLGRTWGDSSNNLKIEQSLANSIGGNLTARSHDWVSVPDNNEMMGHAGAILDSTDTLEAATDPRSDGHAIVAKVT